MDVGAFGLLIEEQHVKLLMRRGKYGLIRNELLDKRAKIDYIATRNKEGRQLRHPFENQITTRCLSLAKFDKFCASRHMSRIASTLYTVIPSADFVALSVDAVEFLIPELDHYDWPASCVHVLEFDANGIRVWQDGEFRAILLARRAEAVTRNGIVVAVHDRSLLIRVRGLEQSITVATDEIVGRSLRIAFNNHLRGMSSLLGVHVLVGVHSSSNYGINAKLCPSGPRISRVT